MQKIQKMHLVTKNGFLKVCAENLFLLCVEIENYEQTYEWLLIRLLNYFVFSPHLVLPEKASLQKSCFVYYW